MPMIHNSPLRDTTRQRFELKYVISEHKAGVIAALFKPYLVPDPNAKGRIEYPIQSIYLDSPTLALYQNSVDGRRNRFKLRIRGYGINGNGRRFLEIKRRVDRTVQKERVEVSPDDFNSLLAQNYDIFKYNHDLNEHENLALLHFTELATRISASPMVDVTYQREAYVGKHNEPVRITFDRSITCAPITSTHSSGCQSPVPICAVIPAPVVLEIKFTDTFPVWIRAIVQQCDLQHQSFCKYVRAVDALQGRGMQRDAHYGRSA